MIRKGSGPQILVLHGGDGPIDRFPFADKLAERFEIIQPVHPGFAGTPIPEHFDNLQDLIFLYLDLIDHLDMRDATLMGFSMGGWAAAEIAVINTQRFSKLVLVDSVGIKVGGPFDRDIADVFAISPAELTRISWHDPSYAPSLGRCGKSMAIILVCSGGETATPFCRNGSSGVLFLASDESSFMTGSELVIDRGWMAQ